MAKINKVTIVGKICLAFFLWLFITNNDAFGQCAVSQTRVYATTEQVNKGLLTNVLNEGQATDNDISTAATLTRAINVLDITGTVTQYLKFDTQVTKGKQVTIKISAPGGILSLLSGIVIQPFTNLHNAGNTLFPNWQADAAGQSFSGGSLLGALNTSGEIEFTILPQKSDGTTVNYDGVSVSLAGVLSLFQSVNVFGAYYTQDAIVSAGCNTNVDVISGVRAGTFLGDIATITSAVSNPRNAIDADLNSYAQLNINLLQAASIVYHTTIFGTLSNPGDVVKMILQNPDGGDLLLNVLDGFTVQLYNGSNPVGQPISSSSGLLSLSLFSPTVNNKKYELTISPLATDGPYDRVEVKMGGIATATLGNGLKIYDVKRIISAPTVSIGGVVTTSQSVCAGSTSTLTINNPLSCTNYNWYDAATGGNLVQGNSTSYTPPAAGLSQTTANNYYVEAVHPGCSEASTRTPVAITVNPPPTAVATMGPTICGGTPSISWAYTATNTPTTYSLVWDAAAHTAGFADVTDAVLPVGNIPVTVPVNAATGTYNGTLYVKNANGCVSAGQPISVAVDAKPTQPVIKLTP